MMEANRALIGCIAIIMCLVSLLLYKIFRDPKNNLSCWQFISSKNSEGDEYADIDKLAKVLALLITTVIVVYYAYKTALDGPGAPMFLALLGIYLSYAGAMASYGAFLRSKTRN